MEKKNKTKSAFKKTTDIFRRNTKSRLAIQKFLNELQEQESEYLNENKQITQCVFLGALCLKPVPDIFQVTLQPISFKTQSKSISYNNIGNIVNNNVTKKDGAVNSEDTLKVKVKKNPRKSNKTSTLKSNVFIDNVCDQKPRNRILELFNNKGVSTDEKIHAKSSKVTLKLDEKSKKDKNIKYKIKVGGILNRNRKDLDKQKEKKVPLKSEQCSLIHKISSQKTSPKTKVPKNKPRNNLIIPEVKKVNENCKIQRENSYYNVSKFIPPLKIKMKGKKCKSDMDIKNSAVDNAIKRLRKNRGIEVTKMETKFKKIPSLVPVKAITSENGSTWEFNKTKHIAQIKAVVMDSGYTCSNSEQGPSFLKDRSIDIMEIVDDEIEDYLEIDQNIVADLEALIPEEEIESISNTFINSSIQMLDSDFATKFNNLESKPVDSVIGNEPFIDVNCDFKNFDKSILVDTCKTKEIIKIDDIKEDVEIEKVVTSGNIEDNINKNETGENGKINNVIETLVINEEKSTEKGETCQAENNKIDHDLEHSKQQIKISTKTSDDSVLISKKLRNSKSVQEESEETKHNTRGKQVHKSEKMVVKLNKIPKVKSKNIRKITDFLFPVEKNDIICTDQPTNYRRTVLTKMNKKETTENVTLGKAPNSVSSDVIKESLVDTRTLRSCSKLSSSSDEIIKLKKIELSKLIPVNNDARSKKEVEVKESMLILEDKTKSIHENNMMPQCKEITGSSSMEEYNIPQQNENVVPMNSNQSVLTEMESSSTPPTTNVRSAVHKSLKKGDLFVSSEYEIVIPSISQNTEKTESLENSKNQSPPRPAHTVIEIKDPKIAERNIQGKKESSEIKKLIKSEIEKDESFKKIGSGSNLQLLLTEKEMDTKLIINYETGLQNNMKIIESRFDLNQQKDSIDKIPTLRVLKTRLRSEAAAEVMKQVPSKFETGNKSYMKTKEKCADSIEENSNDDKISKADISELTTCSQVTAGMERPLDPKAESNYRIEPQRYKNIVEKQQDDRDVKQQDTVSKTRLRSEAVETQKMVSLTKMQNDGKSKTTKVRRVNTSEGVIQETKEVAQMQEIGKSKESISDADHSNRLTLKDVVESTVETISKIESKCEILNDPPSSNTQQVTENQQQNKQNEQLQSVQPNESDEKILSIDVTSEIQMEKPHREGQKVVTIQEHNKKTIIGSTQESGVNISNSTSKTRLQLRKIRTGEKTNESIDFEKSMNLEKNDNSELVIADKVKDADNFGKLQIRNENLMESKNPILHIENLIDKNSHIQSGVKEDALKTNVSRNSRKTKIQNKSPRTTLQLKEKSLLNTEMKPNKKKYSTENEPEVAGKRITKKAVEQNTAKKLGVLDNEKTINGNSSSLIEKKSKQAGPYIKKQNKPRPKAENLKMLNTRSRIKPGNVLKRLTYLRSKTKKKIQLKKSNVKFSTKNINKSINRENKLKKQVGRISRTENVSKGNRKNFFKAKNFSINRSKIEVIPSRHSNSTVAESKSDTNNSNVSSNKKRNKVVKSPTPVILSNAAVGTKAELLSRKVFPIIKKSCNDNTIESTHEEKANKRKLSIQKNEVCEVIFITEHYSEMEKNKSNEERNTIKIQEEDVLPGKIITSNIQNCIATRKKRKIVPKQKYSPNTSKLKSTNKLQLKKNKTELNKGSTINSLKGKIPLIHGEKNNSQDCLGEIKKIRDKPPKQEEFVTEIESDTVKIATRNSRRKKILNRSSYFQLNSPNSDAATQLKLTIVEKVPSADTSLDIVSNTKVKSKHKLQKEEIQESNKDGTLNVENQLKQQHDKQIEQVIPHKLKAEIKSVDFVRNSKILEKVREEHNEIINVTQVTPISEIENSTVQITTSKIRGRRKIQNKSPISSIPSNVATQLKLKNILEKMSSTYTSLNVLSETKEKSTHQLKKEEMEIISEDERLNVGTQLKQEQVIPQYFKAEVESVDFVRDSKISEEQNEIINVAVNVASTNDTPISEVENSTIKISTPKNSRRKKIKNKSLTSKIRSDAATELKLTRKLEKVSSADTLDLFSKTKVESKHQLKKDDIEVVDEGRRFNVGNQLNQHRDKRSDQIITHDLTAGIESIDFVRDSKISEKVSEEQNEIINIAVNVLSTQVKPIFEQKKLAAEAESAKVGRVASRSGKRKKEQNKSSISKDQNNVDDLLQVKNALRKTVIGPLQEKNKGDSEQDIEEPFQQRPIEKEAFNSDKKTDEKQFIQKIEAGFSEDLDLKLEDSSQVEVDIKTRRRHKAPISEVIEIASSTNILTNDASKTKSRKKRLSKKDEKGLTDAKTEVLKKMNENQKTVHVKIDNVSRQVVTSSGQAMDTSAIKDVTIGRENSKNKKRNKEQNKSPISKTQKDLDLLHFKNVSERKGIWLLQQKLNMAFAKTMAEELQQNTKEPEATSLDKMSKEKQIEQQSEKYESLGSIRKTKDQETNDKKIIALKEISNEASNTQKISTENPQKKNEIDEGLGKCEELSLVRSARVGKTQVFTVENNKRSQKRAGPRDEEIKIKVPRKRKNIAIQDANSNKVEIERLDLPESDKTGADDTYNIPYLLKEDLSNPNSELSQEIERQMQLEFSLEFPNYGASAPEPYRRIYRCRICLLVCETYGRLKLHRRIHDVATPYQCQHCDKSFDGVEDLAAHLRIHREVDYAVDEHDTNLEEEEHYIDVEQNNIEEYINIVNEEIALHDDMDIKPMRNNRTYIKENNMCSSTSIKKEKSQEKKKKAEIIQMKIAEIKERLCNDIKKEIDRERMGICQKFTRSKVKQFSVKNELQAETPEAQEEEEFLEETHFEDSKSEGEGLYECDDDPDYEVDTDVRLPIFREYEEVEAELVNGDEINADKLRNGIEESENADSDVVSEMAEAECKAEQKTTGQNFNETGTTLGRKKKKKESGISEGIKKEYTVLELKRDNLPPVLLQTVKKRTKTLIVGKMPYPCKKCDSSFWTSVQLERHQMVHVLKKVVPSNSAAPKKVFKCEVCGKEFRKICDLERHTRVHTGEKPSVCNICNKRFQQAYNLHKHLLTHTQEKNFECVICQKRFGRSDVLNRHVLTHSIDKPYHCSICQKTFIRNTQLKLHLRKHHGMSASQANAAAEEKEAGLTSTRPTTAKVETDDPVAGTSSA